MAIGDQVLDFAPQSAEQPASNPALREWPTGDHTVISYPVSAPDLTAYFTGVMPAAAYAGGNVTLTYELAMASAIAGTVTLLTAWELVTDLGTPGFAADQSVQSATVPGTAGTIFTATLAFTPAQMDGVVAGSLYRLRVQRDTSDASAASNMWLRYLTGVES